MRSNLATLPLNWKLTLKLNASSKQVKCNITSVYNDRTNIYKNNQFDYVLDQSSNQRNVYEKAQIGQLVKAVVDGYHATVFAYGQTGSGKTFTMEGYRYKTNDKGVPIPIIEAGDQEGIVPRAVFQLFEFIKQETSLQKKKYTVHCSYLQIYKEKIYDLLNKSQIKKLTNDGPGLKLRWNKHDHFTVENLYTFECRNADDIMALYHFGVRNKVVASHNMNNQSSRSHTILSLTVEQIDARSPDNIITSKFQLVDLAGSERQSFTGTTANKESIDINKSLFTLRQVITALTDKKNQALANPNQYIPYRESKLTSLLRQSLGGNSFCLMVACLNPCDLYLEENISTLQYASKASFISNKPVKNDDPKMRLIEDLKRENQVLIAQLAKANETILFLSQITGMNPKNIQANLKNVSLPNQAANPKELTQINQIVLGETPSGGASNMSIEQFQQQQQNQQRQGSASSALTEKRGESDRNKMITDRILKDKEQIEKFFKEKSETLQNIAVINQPGNSGGSIGLNGLPSALSETKDLITERIVHTVNMMKEVLQSNLNLRETIQKQSETIDNLNTEMFQLQNENEDLRDRVQILEEYTGKDTYSDLTKLVKEKKVLENRVKHLEQTSMNWAQFQATRTQFHQSKEKIVNQSQNGLPKATIDNEFNYDYEPVRCAINTNTNDASLHVLSDLSKYNNGVSSKKRQKVQQINFAKQPIRNGVKGSQGYTQVQSSIGADHINPSDKHQEYKIRTVKSLAQAYSQQQQIHQQFQQQMMNRNQTTKAGHSNNGANKFMQGNGSQPIHQQTLYTQYEKHRNSLGIAQQPTSGQKFNGNNTQEMNYQDGRPEIIDNTRNRSPLIGQHSGKFVQYTNQQHHQQQQQQNQQRQHTQDDRYGQYKNNQQIIGNPENFPKDLFTREKSVPPMVTQPHVTLRKKDTDTTQSSFNKPPRSTNKYSSSHKKSSNRSGTITQNSHRDRMNVSADYIHNSNNSSNLNDPYHQNQNYHPHTNESDEDEEEGQQQQYYDEEDDENESEDTNQNSDAYEALRIQQIKDLQRQQQQQQQQRIAYTDQRRTESGIGHLDVSLPVIRNSNQPQ